MREISIAYIGGGSKAWARILASDLAEQESLHGVIKLYDIDHKASLRNQKYLSNIFAMDRCKSHWKVQVYNSLEEVLPDSDFTILSILPGTLEDMAIDVHHPETYGIYQSVGDTVGPGGYARAKRLIDAYIPIAEAIKAYAPQSWVINYTNPMTLSVGVLYKVFPEIKAFGCCHEVFGTQKLLADAYKVIKGVDVEIPRQAIKTSVQGINHFTWIDKASYQGQDLLPIYREFVEKYGESGFASDGQSVVTLEERLKEDKVNFFASVNKVKMDLFAQYGLIAAAGDRHLAEFMPGVYLYDKDRVVKPWGFQLTPVAYRQNEAIQLVEKIEAVNAGLESVTLKASDEEGVAIMKGLLGMEDIVTNANFPNRGQAPDLPLGAIVETNLLFTGDRAEPIMCGPLKEEVKDLVMAHVVVQEQFLDGCMRHDEAAMKEAFLLDPAVKRLDREKASQLFEALFERV